MADNDKKHPKGRDPSQPTNASDQPSSNQDPIEKYAADKPDGSRKEGNEGENSQRKGQSNIPVSSKATGEGRGTSKRPSTPNSSASNAPGSHGIGLGSRGDSSGRDRGIKKPQPINTMGSRGASGISISTAKTPASGGSGGPSSSTSASSKNDPKRPWHTAPGFNPDAVSSKTSPGVPAGQKTPAGNRSTSSLGTRGENSPKTPPVVRPTSSFGVRGEGSSRLPIRSGFTSQISPGVPGGSVLPTTASGQDTEADQASSKENSSKQLTAKEKGKGKEVDSDDAQDLLPGAPISQAEIQIPRDSPGRAKKVGHNFEVSTGTPHFDKNQQPPTLTNRHAQVFSEQPRMPLSPPTKPMDAEEFKAQLARKLGRFVLPQSVNNPAQVQFYKYAVKNHTDEVAKLGFAALEESRERSARYYADREHQKAQIYEAGIEATKSKQQVENLRAIQNKRDLYADHRSKKIAKLEEDLAKMEAQRDVAVKDLEDTQKNEGMVSDTACQRKIDAQATEYQKEMDKLSAKNDDLMAEIANLNGDDDSLNLRNDELLKKENICLQRVTDLEKENEKAKREILKLKDDLNKATVGLKRALAHNDSLEKELQDIEKSKSNVSPRTSSKSVDLILVSEHEEQKDSLMKTHKEAVEQHAAQVKSITQAINNIQSIPQLQQVPKTGDILLQIKAIQDFVESMATTIEDMVTQAMCDQKASAKDQEHNNELDEIKLAIQRIHDLPAFHKLSRNCSLAHQLQLIGQSVEKIIDNADRLETQEAISKEKSDYFDNLLDLVQKAVKDTKLDLTDHVDRERLLVEFKRLVELIEKGNPINIQDITDQIQESGQSNEESETTKKIALLDQIINILFEVTGDNNMKSVDSKKQTASVFEALNFLTTISTDDHLDSGALITPAKYKQLEAEITSLESQLAMAQSTIIVPKSEPTATYTKKYTQELEGLWVALTKDWWETQKFLYKTNTLLGCKHLLDQPVDWVQNIDFCREVNKLSINGTISEFYRRIKERDEAAAVPKIPGDDNDLRHQIEDYKDTIQNMQAKIKDLERHDGWRTGGSVAIPSTSTPQSPQDMNNSSTSMREKIFHAEMQSEALAWDVNRQGREMRSTGMLVDTRSPDEVILDLQTRAATAKKKDEEMNWKYNQLHHDWVQQKELVQRFYNTIEELKEEIRLLQLKTSNTSSGGEVVDIWAPASSAGDGNGEGGRSNSNSSGTDSLYPISPSTMQAQIKDLLLVNHELEAEKNRHAQDTQYVEAKCENEKAGLRAEVERLKARLKELRDEAAARKGSALSDGSNPRNNHNHTIPLTSSRADISFLHLRSEEYLILMALSRAAHGHTPSDTSSATSYALMAIELSEHIPTSHPDRDELLGMSNFWAGLAHYYADEVPAAEIHFAAAQASLARVQQRGGRKLYVEAWCKFGTGKPVPKSREVFKKFKLGAKGAGLGRKTSASSFSTVLSIGSGSSRMHPPQIPESSEEGGSDRGVFGYQTVSKRGGGGSSRAPSSQGSIPGGILGAASETGSSPRKGVRSSFKSQKEEEEEVNEGEVTPTTRLIEPENNKNPTSTSEKKGKGREDPDAEEEPSAVGNEYEYEDVALNEEKEKGEKEEGEEAAKTGLEKGRAVVSNVWKGLFGK